jgi:hypothetical protein
MKGKWMTKSGGRQIKDSRMLTHGSEFTVSLDDFDSSFTYISNAKINPWLRESKKTPPVLECLCCPNNWILPNYVCM